MFDTNQSMQFAIGISNDLLITRLANLSGKPRFNACEDNGFGRIVAYVVVLWANPDAAKRRGNQRPAMLRAWHGKEDTSRGHGSVTTER